MSRKHVELKTEILETSLFFSSIALNEHIYIYIYIVGRV